MSKQIVAKVIGYGIAVVAAGSSYSHQVHLLQRNHVGDLFGVVPSAWVTPFTVDALAIVALMVRTDKDAGTFAKRGALVPLILAGGLSVAANIAEASNPVQFIVGIWTVLAYLLAESLAGKIGRKKTADEPMVTRSAADTAVADAVAIVTAKMAALEAQLRAETGALVAEAERVTRDAVGAELTAQFDAERAAIMAASKPARPRVAAATRTRQTVTDTVAGDAIINLRTGKPYSERHTRRLVRGA